MSVLGLSITDTTPLPVGAGFWIRALARFLDIVYCNLVAFAAGILGGIILVILQAASVTDAGWSQRIGGGKVELTVAAIVASLIYHSLCEGIHGATLGKLVCGLRVLSQDLSPCGLNSGLKRSLAYLLDALFFGVIGYLEMQKTVMEQRHGDHWAKTIVVRNAQVPEGSKRSVGRLLLALAAASATYATLMAIAAVWIGI